MGKSRQGASFQHGVTIELRLVRYGCCFAAGLHDRRQGRGGLWQKRIP